MTSEVAELQRQMVTGCQILSQQRLVEGFGHISARLPEGDRILMTPRKALGLVKDPAELLTLDLEGRVLAGEGRPAVEVAMHVAVYRRRPDVRAIARTHSRNAAVFAVLERPVRAVHAFGTHLGAEVPVFANPMLVANREIGEALADLLGDGQAVLLRGTGTLITAPTVVEAVMRAVWLEESAGIQLAALATGQEPRYLTPDEVRVRAALDMPDEPVRAWAYYAALAAGEIP